MPTRDALVVFTKPARPGRVKTRLIGDLSAEEAAEIHAAFRDDLCERLRAGRFHLELSWALDDGDEVPEGPVPGHRQVGEDLGARLFNSLHAAAQRFEHVAAVGSDHPELLNETVEDAFRRLDDGADVVLGPVPDGGYYLIGLRRSAVRRPLFEGIAWSTETVLRETLERSRELGLVVELLPEGQDIDRPDDLRGLVERLASSEGCPRTRALLVSWERMADDL